MDYNNFNLEMILDNEKTVFISKNGVIEKKPGQLIIEILRIFNTDFKNILLSNPFNSKIPNVENTKKAVAWIKEQFENKYDNLIAYFFLKEFEWWELISTDENNKNLFAPHVPATVFKHLGSIYPYIQPLNIFDEYPIYKENKITILHYIVYFFEDAIRNCNVIQKSLDKNLRPLKDATLPIEGKIFFDKDSFKFAIKLNGCFEIIIIELQQIFSKNIVITKCKNCGNYFIPLKRSDTLYCDEISPQDETKTCKEYGKTRTYLDNVKNNDLKYYYKLKYNRLRTRAKRHPEDKNVFDNFIHENAGWQIKVKDNPLAEKDYIEWLKGDDKND